MSRGHGDDDGGGGRDGQATFIEADDIAGVEVALAVLDMVAHGDELSLVVELSVVVSASRGRATLDWPQLLLAAELRVVVAARGFHACQNRKDYE